MSPGTGVFCFLPRGQAGKHWATHRAHPRPFFPLGISPTLDYCKAFSPETPDHTVSNATGPKSYSLL